jgi:hypothetical protein
VLDLLKPHHPSVLELGRLLAGQGGLQVRLTVVEMDDQTETLQVEVSGEDIDFEQLREAIDGFGASLHSIDVVEVEGRPEPAD